MAPAENSARGHRVELLKTFAVAVLVLGLIAASIIYWEGEKRHGQTPDTQITSGAQSSWQDDSLPSGDLKGTSRTIEMNFGQVAVLLIAWLHWWQELKPNESSAILIATIAIVIAVGCFLAAHRELRRRR
jgi:hypothetical protein